jgi:hypothetical protein
VCSRMLSDANSATVGVAPTVSVVIPCLDEAPTIASCVRHAIDVLARSGWHGEVIVVDNGSSDDSAALAEAAGARVVREPRRGYGSACRAGFTAARGRYIIMADGDLTYDFEEIPRFVDELDRGADLVVGDRMDHIDPGAMSRLHRYVGNPLLSGLLNVLFRTGVRDSQCGMRALRRDALAAMDLRTTGMEFASEMVVRGSKAGLEIRQLPIAYRIRGGESKLSSFRDGWRHLRFLLVHAPTYLFVVPGALMTVLGIATALTVLAGIEVLGRAWDIHALVAGALVTIVGVQVLTMGAFAHAYAYYYMGEDRTWFARIQPRFRLEHGVLVGGLVLLSGLVLCAVIIGVWIDRGFGYLSEERLAVVAATLVIIGVQIVFSSFLLSILGLRRIDS